MKINWQEGVGLLARHGLGAIGAALVTHGAMTQTDADQLVNVGQQVVGGVGLLGALVWSAYQKIQQNDVVGSLAKMQKVAPQNMDLAEAAERGKEAVAKKEEKKAK